MGFFFQGRRRLTASSTASSRSREAARAQSQVPLGTIPGISWDRAAGIGKERSKKKGARRARAADRMVSSFPRRDKLSKEREKPSSIVGRGQIFDKGPLLNL